MIKEYERTKNYGFIYSGQISDLNSPDLQVGDKMFVNFGYFYKSYHTWRDTIMI